MPPVPELPEVEVLRRSLQARVVGRRIVGVATSGLDLREPIPSAQLEEHAVGRRIERLHRRSKYLLMELQGGWTVAVHLGMSGRFVVAGEGDPRGDHEHLTLTLDRRESLRLRDPRRFGMVLVLPSAGLSEDRHFRHLGVEPLADGFDGERLRRRARGRRGPIKNFLMDGRIVVGIGNIYACEALHRAGVHPRRSVGRISAGRWERLATVVGEVLREAIREGGTTLNDFADGVGNEGWFQVSLEVYGRAGETCSRCGATVRRIVMAGRGTFYCPGCQR
jgi:formamidopyrimidine-DNA glycosylase